VNSFNPIGSILKAEKLNAAIVVVGIRRVLARAFNLLTKGSDCIVQQGMLRALHLEDSSEM